MNCEFFHPADQEDTQNLNAGLANPNITTIILTTSYLGRFNGSISSGRATLYGAKAGVS